MSNPAPISNLHAQHIESLYVDAMLLADEARSMFDHNQRGHGGFDALTTVEYSCESLKATTRLMHVIAWVLTQRAVMAGEISLMSAGSPARMLGQAIPADRAVLGKLPAPMRALIDETETLFARARTLQDQISFRDHPLDSPARVLQARLTSLF